MSSTRSILARFPHISMVCLTHTYMFSLSSADVPKPVYTCKQKLTSVSPANSSIVRCVLTTLHCCNQICTQSYLKEHLCDIKGFHSLSKQPPRADMCFRSFGNCLFDSWSFGLLHVLQLHNMCNAKPDRAHSLQGKAIQNTMHPLHRNPWPQKHLPVLCWWCRSAQRKRQHCHL